jgi:O-glycosyl hydrolase
MRLAVAALLVAGVSTAAWVFEHGRASTSTEKTVTAVVDARATRQVIDGFGSSERVWSEPHLADDPRVNVPPAAQAQILTLLYRTIGLTRVRNVLDQGVQKQPGGPFDFAGKLADDHVSYVKQARAYGLRTFFPGPVYLEPWMKESNPGATVEWAMAMLQHWRSKGLAPKLYAPLNEPWVAGNFDPEWMHQVVLQLGRRLRAAALETKLVIPDDENPTDAYRRAVAVLGDSEARSYVGALAYHIYRWERWDPKDLVRLRELATRYRLPLWMTEYSSRSYKDWNSSFDWAYRMHVLLTTGSVNAIDFLWGFFGEKYGTDTMVSIDFDDGAYRGHTMTAVGAITAQYAHFVRPGSVRVGVTGSSDDLAVSAYRSRGRLIVVATNPGLTATSLRLTVKRARLVGPVRQVRSTDSERLRQLPTIGAGATGFTATLAPRSVTTFTAST